MQSEDQPIGQVYEDLDIRAGLKGGCWYIGAV